MGAKVFLILCMTVLASQAHAALLSCLPDFTSAQMMERIDLSQSESFRQTLKTSRGTELVSTRAFVDAAFTAGGNQELNLDFGFEPGFGEIGLPFHIYAVLVILDGEVKAYIDLTHGCSTPGMSFLPGRKKAFPVAIKLPGVGKHLLQITIWGRQ